MTVTFDVSDGVRNVKSIGHELKVQNLKLAPTKLLYFTLCYGLFIKSEIRK